MENRNLRKIKELEIDIEENKIFITKLTNLINKLEYRVKDLEIHQKCQNSK